MPFGFNKDKLEKVVDPKTGEETKKPGPLSHTNTETVNLERIESTSGIWGEFGIVNLDEED